MRVETDMACDISGRYGSTATLKYGLFRFRKSCFSSLPQSFGLPEDFAFLYRYPSSLCNADEIMATCYRTVWCAVLISFLVYSTRKVIEFEILERIKRGFMRFEFCYISNSIVSPYFRKRFNNEKMFKIGFWIFTG